MSELPETVTNATETGEKMIPLSAVEPLAALCRATIAESLTTNCVDPRLMAAYDHLAGLAGWPSASMYLDLEHRTISVPPYDGSTLARRSTVRR